ncbi:exgA [Symbiodinium sp. CCMP2592]|nr:exgA [Symbiodinium sp. CCMP2592]
MAIQFGFYWWHVSNADASLAERSLSHAVQSFHVAHWCHSAWRGANLGGWMLLEPGPASPFFNVCHAKILELSGGPAQESLETSGARDPPSENPPGLGDEYSVCAALQAAGGECLRSELFQWHRSQHYTEQTFADIAKTGLNAVRVPFGHWVVQGPGSGEPYEGPCLEVLDGCVQMAEAQGLQVLLDLHGNPGGESGSRPCGRESATWRWEDWRHDEAVEVLRLLAARYCDKSCVTGVQVCNEPSENIPADRLCDFYEQAIEAIRSSGMGPDKVAVVLPIFTHWRLKEMLNCWNSRGNSFKFDNIAFDIHYYHDFSAIWRLLPHYRHIEVVAEHARELKLLPGSVVGEWSLSRPGYFSEEEKADFAQKQVVAYNHASHGWFFWNWHDHAFYPDWDLEKGVFGSGKLPCPLRHEELQGFLFPAWEGSGPVTRPLAQAERELMRLKESLTKDTSQFPAMARKHSECKSALQPGQMAGDLGWISKGSLGDQTMEDVVLALEVNELSDLVTTARGVCALIVAGASAGSELKCVEAKVTSSTDCTRRKVQELVTFATIPPHQRSPAMAPARVLQRINFESYPSAFNCENLGLARGLPRASAMERSNVFRQQAAAKSWSPSSSLPVLREGVAELEAHADGVDYAVHEAWQERSLRAAVLEKPMVQALQLLPGIRQHPLLSRPPPPPRSIVPCPPCDPPHHAMRQRSAQVRRPHARQCFSMDESAKATSKRKDPKSKSCVEKTLCWTSRDARRGLLIYAA